MEPPGVPCSKGPLGGERLARVEKNYPICQYVSKQMPLSWPPPPTDLIGDIPRGAKSKVGLKYAKIVRSSSGASAHSNARKGIVKDCLSRKSGVTKESGPYSQRCSNYASGFWAPKLSRKSASYDLEVSKNCSVEK